MPTGKPGICGRCVQMCKFGGKLLNIGPRRFPEGRKFTNHQFAIFFRLCYIIRHGLCIRRTNR
jgi:hypothetical protein